MNRRIFSAFALLALATLTTAAVASAQDIARADIPFEFRAGAKALPAGSYEVSGLNSWAIVLRNRDAGESAAILAQEVAPGTDSGDATLVFHRYGDRYFLTQVRMPNLTRDFPMTKLERELASRQVAASTANDAGRQVIYLAARLQ